jgi:hypothetical protein
MTTHKKESQSVVVNDAIAFVGGFHVAWAFVSRWFGFNQQLHLGSVCGGASDGIDGPASSGGCEPRAGISWNAVAVPRGQSLGEGLLDAFLRDIKIACHARRRRENPCPLGAESVIDGATYFLVH